MVLGRKPPQWDKATLFSDIQLNHKSRILGMCNPTDLLRVFILPLLNHVDIMLQKTYLGFT